MKKKVGVNGNWVSVSTQQRLAQAGLPSLVTLGMPAAIHTLISFNVEGAEQLAWFVSLIFWAYGLLFWWTSTGKALMRRQRWEWTQEALDERQRYVSDARARSKEFWGHWWVRFPIGLLFLVTGIFALGSPHIALQLLSILLLMMAFVTPFVFMTELLLLPISVGLILMVFAVVDRMPVSLIVLFGVAAIAAVFIMVLNRRSQQRAATKIIIEQNAAGLAEGEDPPLQDEPDKK